MGACSCLSKQHLFLADLIVAIVVVFLMALLYEGFKTLREYLVYLDMKRSQPSPRKSIQEDDDKNDRTQLLMSDTNQHQPKGYE